jgi:hypothetical protein
MNEAIGNKQYFSAAFIDKSQALPTLDGRQNSMQATKFSYIKQYSEQFATME